MVVPKLVTLAERELCAQCAGTGLVCHWCGGKCQEECDGARAAGQVHVYDPVVCLGCEGKGYMEEAGA